MAWAGFALCVFVVVVPLAPLARGLHVEADPKRYPVTRVVQLLKDMQAQLQKEADADEEVYDKLACWCTTNDKAKTKAIEDAEARLSDLGTTIEKMTAQSARLNIEIEGLVKEVKQNQEALDAATALRTRQLADFNAEEKEMIQSIKALEAAVVVLSKHHGRAALDQKTLASVMATVGTELRKHKVLLLGTITPHQKRMLMSLTQEDYNPQSGEIFGILKQMKTTFEADLSESQKEELANQRSFQELKEAKEVQIQSGQASLQEKKQQLAGTDEKLATAKEDKEDTEASLSADQKFLINLKDKCSLTDKEWEERQKMRNEEVKAVAEAIAILTADDSRDLFSRTFNAASFLQEQRVSVSSQERDLAARGRAVHVLLTAAAETHNPRLVALATSARLDAFTKVKEAIDNMVVQLVKEKEDEIKHRDFCIEGLNNNELVNENKVHEKGTLQSKIAGLQQTVKSLVDAISTLEAEVIDLQTALKRAGEDRQLELQEFQITVADQRETQSMLKKALDVLKNIYPHDSGTSLSQATQKRTDDSPAPPPGFDEARKSDHATGIMMLIEQIVADAKEMEAEAVHAEEQAVKAFEGLKADTNASVEAKQNGITNKTEEKAQANQELTQAKSELEGVDAELEGLGNDKGALHKSCDYTLTNWQVRQDARDQEIEALHQAKAYLSGMK